MVHRAHLSKTQIAKVLSNLNATIVCRKDDDYILKNIYLIEHNPKISASWNFLFQRFCRICTVFGSLPSWDKQQFYSSCVQYCRTSNKSYRIFGGQGKGRNTMPLTPVAGNFLVGIFSDRLLFSLQPWLIVQYFSKYNASYFNLHLNSSIFSEVGFIKL
jgi:hypothetical protein